MVCVALAGAIAAPAGAQAAFAPYPRGVDPASPNPLAGQHFFVDRRQPAFRQYRWYRHTHRRRAAKRIWRLAREPKFRWFGRWSHHLRSDVRVYIRRAQHRHQVPLIVVMRAQAKKCHGGYTGGDRREDSRTRKWYRKFARAVGRSRVVIGFEPDSLGTLDCQTKSRRRVRLKLLAYGVRVLSRLSRATIYLEGGASDWEPARRTARQLRIIGIRRVRGFMLNVTHFDWTSSNIRHGLQISRLTGGKHFIISTAFNGRGALHYRRYFGPHKWRMINVWCHPPRRGLGPRPTTITDHPRVDAYMWIGRPGFSAGKCN
ncbi:MAG TPA: glycoside hydrolase family 6 protein, partial [Gaiellales bacterium]|nr:glycoside hydrolase family 6 protein [Gaiellales bacterium]